MKQFSRLILAPTSRVSFLPSVDSSYNFRNPMSFQTPMPCRAAGPEFAHNAVALRAEQPEEAGTASPARPALSSATLGMDELRECVVGL